MYMLPRAAPRLSRVSLEKTSFLHPSAHASVTEGKSVGRVVRVMVPCLSRVDARHLAGFHEED